MQRLSTFDALQTRNVPDLQHAQDFLRQLAGSASVTFQTFDDQKRSRRNLTCVLHGGLEQHGKRLSELNGKGAGVFAMVNEGDLRGRSTANVKSVRAAFVDLDGAPIEPVLAAPYPPHIVVESSPSRYHAYWLVDGLALGEFSAVQKSLAWKFEGDPSVKDLPRVMRLPGFVHHKSEPFTTMVKTIRDAPRLKRAEFLEAFEIDLTTQDWKSTLIPEGKRDETLFNMARGFVTKGMLQENALERLQKTNAERCKPPLSANDVAKIVSQAYKYGAPGSVQLDFALLDSPEYRALSLQARSLDLANRRRANCNDTMSFSLRLQDAQEWGIQNAKTLKRYRDELIDAGFLVVVRSPTYGAKGDDSRECGLYRISTPAFMAESTIKKESFYGRKCHLNNVDIYKGSER